jgi:hypothetical protein
VAVWVKRKPDAVERVRNVFLVSFVRNAIRVESGERNQSHDNAYKNQDILLSFAQWFNHDFLSGVPFRQAAKTKQAKETKETEQAIMAGNKSEETQVSKET